MLHPYDHYVAKIDGLNDEQATFEFLLRVGCIMKRYLEEDEKPKVKKCIGGAKWKTYIKAYDTTKLDAIAREYYNACDLTEAEKQYYLHTSHSEADHTSPVIFEATECCQTPEIVLLAEYAVCAHCGQKVRESNQYTANFTDASISPNKTFALGVSPASVNNETSNLLSDPILRIQGLKVATFSDAKWSRIYHAVTNGIEPASHKDISHAQIYRVLQQLKMSEFYSDTPVIWETITGNKLKPIPDGALWVIQNVISPQLCIGTSMKTKDGTVVQTIQRSFGKSFLGKALELVGCREYLHLLKLGEDTLRNLNPLWEKFCLQGGWKYYASS